MLQRTLIAVIAAVTTGLLASCGGTGPTPVVPCTGGLTRCGSVCVSVATSSEHCGACGAACGAGEVCSSGDCVCATGTTDCGGTCTDLSSNNAHCGGCGIACTGSDVC